MSTNPRVGLTAGSAAAAVGAARGRGLKPCAIQIPCGTHLGARSLDQMQHQDEAEEAEWEKGEEAAAAADEEGRGGATPTGAHTA